MQKFEYVVWRGSRMIYISVSRHIRPTHTYVRVKGSPATLLLCSLRLSGLETAPGNRMYPRRDSVFDPVSGNHHLYRSGGEKWKYNRTLGFRHWNLLNLLERFEVQETTIFLISFTRDSKEIESVNITHKLFLWIYFINKNSTSVQTSNTRIIE